MPSLARVLSDEKPSYFADLKDGLNYIFTHDLVRWVMVVFAFVFLLAVAPSNLSPLVHRKKLWNRSLEANRR